MQLIGKAQCSLRFIAPPRHPLPEIQVCEIGRRGGGRGKGNTISDEELLCIALSGLFQHLPAVLDEDVASVAVGTADVRIVMRYVL